MIYWIQNKFLKVGISSNGAQLQSICGTDGTEYLWQGDPKYWSDRDLTLFPYVARLTDNQYYLDGNCYSMGIHGLAPYQNFACITHEPDRLILEMTETNETLQQYPRAFSFRVAYRLRGNQLDIQYEVENRDNRTMYFGLGGHPGFNVPLSKGMRFEDYRLRFSERCNPVRVGFSETCFPNGADCPVALQNGTVLPLRHELFDHDAMVLKGVPREVTLECQGDPHTVTVRFPQMPYLGIWHMPHSDAPYVCLEPWCCLPSRENIVEHLETQPGILRAEPGEVYCNLWWITINE